MCVRIRFNVLLSHEDSEQATMSENGKKHPAPAPKHTHTLTESDITFAMP